jgi:hypothetical protein
MEKSDPGGEGGKFSYAPNVLTLAHFLQHLTLAYRNTYSWLKLIASATTENIWRRTASRLLA